MRPSHPAPRPSRPALSTIQLGLSPSQQAVSPSQLAMSLDETSVAEGTADHEKILQPILLLFINFLFPCGSFLLVAPSSLLPLPLPNSFHLFHFHYTKHISFRIYKHCNLINTYNSITNHYSFHSVCKHYFINIDKSFTDEPTDQPMDQPTNRQTKPFIEMHLKIIW